MKRILLILGHPDSGSFCGSLSESYGKGAERAGHEVRSLFLGDMEFDPVLHFGYKKIQKLEPDLKKAQSIIKWADHIVFVYPVWWYASPSLLKGFIDRSFLPGFAFNFKKGSFKWDKHLKGKTAEFLITLGSFPIFYKLFLKSPDQQSLKNVLRFCGFKVKKVSYFGPMMFSTLEKRKKWIKKARQAGEKA